MERMNNATIINRPFIFALNVSLIRFGNQIFSNQSTALKKNQKKTEKVTTDRMIKTMMSMFNERVILILSKTNTQTLRQSARPG